MSGQSLGLPEEEGSCLSVSNAQLRFCQKALLLTCLSYGEAYASISKLTIAIF